jgi:SPP1 family predicted phage head-tail adaptor
MLAGLNITDLDRKLTFQSVVETVSVVGNSRTLTFQDTFTCYGKVEILQSGSEKFEGDQQVALENARIVIRYRAGVTETMRVKDVRNNVFWYITNVMNFQREGYCQVEAEGRDNKLV